jgi:hypothetical protein
VYRIIIHNERALSEEAKSVFLLGIGRKTCFFKRISNDCIEAPGKQGCGEKRAQQKGEDPNRCIGSIYRV